MEDTTTTTTTTTTNGNCNNDDIKTMQLYNDIERIDNELRALGLAASGDATLDPTVLSKIDSMHYEGDSAIQAAIDKMKISESSRILDIGSGFGGPARYLAHKTNCHVTAIEIQQDIATKAADLTARCQLQHKVTHIVGDILDNTAMDQLTKTGDNGNSDNSITGIVSWLVFLHIEDKKFLFQKCGQFLPCGGKLFADDFFMISQFTQVEEISLQKDVYCAKLPTQEEYIQVLCDVGFSNVKFEDRTEEWKTFVNNRLENFIASRERFVRVNSEPTYEKLLHFYSAVVTLFNGGHLGGVRLTADWK